MTFGLADCGTTDAGSRTRMSGRSTWRVVTHIDARHGCARTVPERRRRGEGDTGSFPTSFCGVPLSNCGDTARFGDGELESVSRSAMSACVRPGDSGMPSPQTPQAPLYLTVRLRYRARGGGAAPSSACAERQRCRERGALVASVPRTTSRVYSTVDAFEKHETRKCASADSRADWSWVMAILCNPLRSMSRCTLMIA